MKIGDSVMTEFGKGKIVAMEEIYKIPRWGVELEKNPFSYSPAYFWSVELTELVGDDPTSPQTKEGKS